MSSTKMAAFTGEIRIEAGAFMVNTNLMTGPLNLSTAPTVVVSNGASFALATTDATCPAPNKNATDEGLHLCNHFHIQGTGVDNHGAIANLLGNNQMYLFRGDWTLDGDTLLCGRSVSRYDLTGGPTVYMNGHTITIRKGISQSNRWTFCPGSARFIDGQIIVDNSYIKPQGGNASSTKLDSWIGDENNVLTVTNWGHLSFYNTDLKIPWKLDLKDNTGFDTGGSAGNRCDVGYTNRWNHWYGPIMVGNNVRIYGSADQKGLVPWGGIYGTGPLKVITCWLNLVTPNPDYLGSIHVTDFDSSISATKTFRSGLALYTPGAYDPAAAGVTLTNAELRLMSDDAYTLPPVEAYVREGTNYAFSGGGNVRCASLKKTGPGTFDLVSPVSVTGKLELAGGTLRFPPAIQCSTAPGLWQGTLATNGIVNATTTSQANSAMAAYMNRPTPTYTNEVTRGADLFRVHTYPPWEDYLTATWSGYIWNRSETNEMWTFALNFGGYARFWIDDMTSTSPTLGIDNNGGMNFLTKSISPGAHTFVLKANPRGYRIAGSLSATTLANGYKIKNTDIWVKYPNWASNMGFAIDRLGRGTSNVVDYVFGENNSSGAAGSSTAGGDGFLFTRDNKPLEEYDREALFALTARGQQMFSNFVAHAGTTVDLGEGNMFPFVLDAFEGVTTVTNGNFRIKETWRLRPEYLTPADGTLTVCGKLKFDAGVVLEGENLSLLPRSREYVIARATEGIEGLPTWAPANPNYARWHLAKAKDADGNDILMFTWAAGTTIIMR